MAQIITLGPSPHYLNAAHPAAFTLASLSRKAELPDQATHVL